MNEFDRIDIAEESVGLNIENCSTVDDNADTPIVCCTIPIMYSNIDDEFKSNMCEHTENTKAAVDEEKLDFHSRMVNQFRSFALKVEKLPVAQNSKDCVFDLAKDLLRESYNFNCASIKRFIASPGEHISEVLKLAQCEILNEIQKYDTREINSVNSMSSRRKRLTAHIGKPREIKNAENLSGSYSINTPICANYRKFEISFKKISKKLYLDYNVICLKNIRRVYKFNYSTMVLKCAKL